QDRQILEIHDSADGSGRSAGCQKQSRSEWGRSCSQPTRLCAEAVNNWSLPSRGSVRRRGRRGSCHARRSCARRGPPAKVARLNSLPRMMRILTRPVFRLALLASAAALLASSAAAADQGYFGRWALTIPGGGAGWLELRDEGGWYDGSILWGGGSVVPVSSVIFTDDAVMIMRTREVRRRDAAGKVVRTQQFTEALRGVLDGDTL